MAITPQPARPVDSRRPYLFLAIGVVIGVLVTLAATAGLQAWQTNQASAEHLLAQNRRDDPSVTETASGLQYKILAPGKGTAKPTDADVTLVNYEGKLLDGTTFDKSQQPTPMPVKGVVAGFSEGLKLMSKGAKYRLWIKPSLGYKDKAMGPIPANSVLVFDVELLDFLPESVIRQMQQRQQMMQQQGGPAAPGGPPPGAATAPGR